MNLIKDPRHLERVVVRNYDGALIWREGARVEICGECCRVVLGFDSQGRIAGFGHVSTTGEIVELTGEEPPVDKLISQAGISFDFLIQFAFDQLDKQLLQQESGEEIPGWEEFKQTLTQMDGIGNKELENLWLHVHFAAYTACGMFFLTGLVGGPRWIDETRELWQHTADTNLAREDRDIMAVLADFARVIDGWHDEDTDEQDGIVASCLAMLLVEHMRNSGDPK